MRSEHELTVLSHSQQLALTYSSAELSTKALITCGSTCRALQFQPVISIHWRVWHLQELAKRQCHEAWKRLIMTSYYNNVLCSVNVALFCHQHAVIINFSKGNIKTVGRYSIYVMLHGPCEDFCQKERT